MADLPKGYPLDQHTCQRTGQPLRVCRCADCVLPPNAPGPARDYTARPTTIYFIRGGENGPIKIGYADRPASRLAYMQIGHWEELKILATLPGTPADEAALHDRFRSLHIRGEWFRAEAELLDFIASVRASQQGDAA